MRAGLAEIEQALERYGLLLEHDKELPSVTLLVAGEPIRGSWWGHELGHYIYDLLGELDERSGSLATKILDGKVTYVHPRLWPAFLSVADDPDPARRAGLSRETLSLLDCVQKHGPVRADADVIPAALGNTRDRSKAIRALETRLHIHTDSLHTESGAHVKVLQTWAHWRAAHGAAASTMNVADGKSELDRAVAGLCGASTRRPKVPWSRSS